MKQQQPQGRCIVTKATTKRGREPAKAVTAKGECSAAKGECTVATVKKGKRGGTKKPETPRAGTYHYT